MTVFKGKKVTLRPGATYGRGDDPHGVTDSNSQVNRDRGHENMVTLPDNYREMTEEQKDDFFNHRGTISDRQRELARRNYIW